VKAERIKGGLDERCRACGSVTTFIQKGKVLGFCVSYFDCPVCAYVQTEAPFWLPQAYSEAINDSDTGIMVRNYTNARIVLATMLMLKKLDETIVDFAGGYGILVRLLRDYGINALWSDMYCKNLLACGFEYTNEKSGLVTAFEAFEHFVDPAVELDRLLAIAPNVLLSTEIIAHPAPKQKDWWYYAKYSGQHIGFFRIKTLQKLAQERGKYLVTNGTSYHLIADKPINQSMWKLMIRFNKVIPLLLRRKLVSKVWTDYNLIASLDK